MGTSRSNSALLTNAYHSALRTPCGAARRERWASRISRLSAVAAIFALCIAASPAIADEWTFGSLRIHGFDGFVAQPTREPPWRLTNSAGAEILVSVVRISPQAMAERTGGDPQKRVRIYEDLAQHVYGRSAKAYTPLIPLKRERLADGTILISGALEKVGSRFFLVYTVVAPSDRVALLTVEGRGDPRGQYQHYRSAFESVQWLD